MTYKITSSFLFRVELAIEFVDSRTVRVRVPAERDVQSPQEAVAPRQQALGRVSVGFDRGLAVEDDDAVGKVRGHDEIMLDYHRRLLGVHDEALDDARGDDTLFRVQVSRGFVDKVDVGWHAQGQHDGHTLQLSPRQVLHFLIDEVVKFEGLVDVRLELRGEEGGLDLLEEQLSHRALEFGRDLLRLHADVHLRHLLAIVGLLGAGEHFTECRLACAVLAHQDNDLRVGELPFLDCEVERTQSLRHFGEGVAAGLVGQKLLAGLANAELQALLAEAQVLGRDVAVEKDVDAFTDGEGGGNDAIDRGFPIEHANVVRQIVQDGQVVLDNDDVAVGSQQAADHTAGGQTLPNVKEGGRLIKHVHIGLLYTGNGDGEALQLAA